MIITVENFCKIFDMDFLPNIIRVLGVSEDLENFTCSWKEFSKYLSIDQNIAAFLFEKTNVHWNFKEIVDYDMYEIGSYVYYLYDNNDERLNNIRLDITPESLERLCSNLHISRDDIITAVIYGNFSYEIFDAVLQYLKIPVDLLTADTMLANKLKRFPRKRFYNAIYQIMEKGVEYEQQ